MMAAWYEQTVDGVLLDITGVLYNSGHDGGHAIPGSVDAVNRLRGAGLPVRFCTNETTSTKAALVKKLQGHGFTMTETDVFPPAPAVCSLLKQRHLRPYLLVHPNARPNFADIDTSNPNCVVMGDAADHFTYENMNKAFKLLMSLEEPVLISMGRGKYYREEDENVLDVGAYMKALEYACDIEAEIVGKPSPSFFNAALEDMGVTSDKVVMVGDDVVNDVGGSQACGMRGVLVRTGKYRPSDEHHPTVTPSGVVDNLAEAVDLILNHR
ncbi:phospholysine phosphohistidine inorganic pyrophosphate phosphatase-like [Haliotis rufescens]|uniref:phospholysine phosphohistidine inorganic pyrophosphate phosphatase-like n=1 Tax=Haliotis rufescens TaxID=6454 RepID=UPI001EB02647|nr:phospholysine phosphohistidine inorganic pyrophosphate phosphatase-like [Haliotis rufescens]